MQVGQLSHWQPLMVMLEHIQGHILDAKEVCPRSLKQPRQTIDMRLSQEFVRQAKHTENHTMPEAQKTTRCQSEQRDEPAVQR